MAMVHWHEGLFLQPHHLQELQRQSLERGASERRLSWAHPYGVIESRVSGDALENLTVRFDRLRAVMPSGLEVDVPGNAELPTLEIKRVFQASTAPFTVSLAAPLWQASRANTVEYAAGADDPRVKRLWRVAEVERPDENTGENVQPVMVRKVNARLVTDADDTTDMEVLPLIRVVHGVGEEAGIPRADASFVPPCLVLSGSTLLRNTVRDLGNQVEASRKDLVNQMTRAGWSPENIRGVQFEQMLRLRTLNRFAAVLPALAAAPGATPFGVSVAMRECLGELAALYPDRDPFDAARYDHDNPAVSILDLDKKIRGLLRGAVQRRYLEIKFKTEAGVLAAALGEEHFTQPNEYFLAFKTKEDPTVLARLVEDADKFKLMPKSMVKLNIFGVKLAEERHPPLELPSHAGLHYFRLVRAESAKMWERVQQEKSVAVRWPEQEGLDLGEVSLFMTIA